MTQPQAALPAEAGHWWALALRGAIAILFGLAALLRPGIALEALILLFGAYALVDGVFAIVGIFGGTQSGTPRWLLLIRSGRHPRGPDRLRHAAAHRDPPSLPDRRLAIIITGISR